MPAPVMPAVMPTAVMSAVVMSAAVMSAPVMPAAVMSAVSNIGLGLARRQGQGRQGQGGNPRQPHQPLDEMSHRRGSSLHQGPPRFNVDFRCGFYARRSRIDRRIENFLRRDLSHAAREFSPAATAF